MQPYIYMSVGVRADGLDSKDIELLEELASESYFYCEDFAEDEQVFAFEVLHSPWSQDNYADTKTLDFKQISKLYDANKGKILKYQNLLKVSNLEHIVDRVDVIVHVTEL